MSSLQRHSAAQRGMTLVDLLVGCTIGLFLVGVMGAVYLGSKTTFVAQDSGARIQENGRFAVDVLSNDLRMSGFRGCRSIDPRTNLPQAVNNTLNSAATLRYNYAQPIWASRNVSGGWAPALEAPLTGLSPNAAGDVLVLRRPVGVGWSLVGEMAATSDALSITATANFTTSDLLMVADCASADVLQATNATPGANGSIAHVVGANAIVPGVATAALSRRYAHDARVWRMQSVMYYLAASTRHTGQMALWSHTTPVYDGSPATAELVTGVERMAVTFGVDTNADSAADRFQNASQVTNWDQVVSARVELLVAGAESDSVTTTPQPYNFDGATTTPTDRRLRTVMSTVVSLRNAVP